ncbi:three-helix bundle dimerization domain-containing protein [Nocardia harenae]|uniref:three-helix bundle dimerization domain-containing protein n=1 Tax=Nocardia harenae TaxID=358707 RepID=UPI0008370895|nr:hypothetical protein [Nocardia harenae]
MSDEHIAPPPQHDPTLDPDVALHAAARRLEQEYGDVADETTIERALHDSHQEVAEGASVETFLPLLAERNIREQLQDAAEAERTES